MTGNSNEYPKHTFFVEVLVLSITYVVVFFFVKK